MRGSNHSKDIRLFEITDEGIVIGETLSEYAGIMTELISASLGDKGRVMNRNYNDGATDTPYQLGVTSLHQNRRPTLRRQGARRRESDTIDDETSVLNRENFAAAREDAADLREGKATSREDAVYLRESTATSRELEICVAEAAQAASDDHMIILQQANSHLVVATIEAQKLTEQVEIAKIQMYGGKIQLRQIRFSFQHEP